MLEVYCAAQSEATVVAANWGRSTDQRVGDLKQRMDDVELLRLLKLRDERDDSSKLDYINQWPQPTNVK